MSPVTELNGVRENFQKRPAYGKYSKGYLKMNELVSIIMPSYNSSKYISESINSVLSQTYTNWELLVIDDCSTDNTVQIIQSFNDSRIRLLRNPVNSGAAISRNYGLREAKGKWIAFLDSDDMWKPEKLDYQIRYMKENGRAFTYHDYRTSINGKLLPYVNTAPNVVNKRKIYNYCYLSTDTVMYDADIIGVIQIADLKKNNDYAMWLQAIEKSEAYRIPRCMSYYVRHDDSISGGKKYKLIKWHYYLFRKGLNKGPIVSVALTVNNLIHGVIKKIIYKRAVTEED